MTQFTYRTDDELLRHVDNAILDDVEQAITDSFVRTIDAAILTDVLQELRAPHGHDARG